jgi:glycosyltransferase involved in cell wall biosynthesis
MKTSLICTVLNEESTIDNLLDSLLKQTRKPDEIVIVDGGSKDRTVKILKAHSKRFPIPIRIIVAEGANISQGRNIAIKNAKWPVIVTTDGGTVHDRNWFKSIVKNIEDGCDVSAGLFFPLPKTKFEEIVGRLFYPDMSKVPDDWPPSSRSAAFTKKIWERAGGYPEELYTAEDAVFNHRLKAIGAKYKTARNAKSYWRPRPNFRKFVKQYFIYAEGNGESALAITKYPENRMFYAFWGMIAAAVLAYLIDPWVLALLLAAFIAGLFTKSMRALKNLRDSTIGTVLLLSAFKANVLGTHYGLLRRLLCLVKVKKVKGIKIVK